MKIVNLSLIILLTASVSSCHKADSSPVNASSFEATETTVISSFVNNTALPQYGNLTSNAVALNASIQALTSVTTDANLLAAQASWKSIRSTWEQCEGFLLGPVEDNDYDPNTDTWPTDYIQMDSLLASNNPLQVSDVQALPQTLRGYHPIEYLIFGVGGTRKASDITDREKLYLTSLSSDILNNNVQPLYQSWTNTSGGYAQAILTAGAGSTVFATKQDFYRSLVGVMSDICNEVGSEKMYDPFIAKDSFLTESPYSGNTLIDFKSNIIGVRNVYLGLNGSTGLSTLIAAKNKSLDNQIQTQLSAAINSFDAISGRYEEAIFTQRVQVQSTMDQLATLKGLLDNDLTNFIVQYVQD